MDTTPNKHIIKKQKATGHAVRKRTDEWQAENRGKEKK